MEINVNNFLIKFIQIASLAVVLAVLITLCSVLPSNTRENSGEPSEPVPVPVIAESVSYGTIAEKMEYSEDSPIDDSEQSNDTITGTITQTDVPNDSINAETSAPEKTAEAPISVPASVSAPTPVPTPAPARTVVSVNNQDKPVATINPGNVTNSGRGNSDQVIDDSTQAIQIDPNNAAAYHSRGFAYYTKGEYDRAIADFTKAIQIDPKNAVTYNNRGAAYSNKGEFDLAIADLDQAIKLNPDFENPYRHRAFAYMKKNNYKQARTDVNKAMQINPGNHSSQEISVELKRLGY